jgi:glycosyltransferase involved in cell wall biosynthesis
MSDATVVITAGVAWGGTTARPQHFARGLARLGWDVLYVNPQISWLSPVKNNALRAQLVPFPFVQAVADDDFKGQLTVLAPIAGMPFANMYRTVNRWNQRLLAHQIKSTARGPYLLLPMLPNSVDLIPHLAPLATVYDCVDFHAQFGGLSTPAVIEQMERELVYQSRVVFATADKLRHRLLAHHVDVRLLPNAAEIQHFAKAKQVEVHPRLLDIPSPRVGFIGGIGSWVDLDFIAGFAKARPNVHVALIGPIETDVGTLAALPNVHLLGLQPYAELPQFLAGFDATLVTFRRSELAQSVNPVKVYEYLAAGKEVIATPIHELQKMRELLWIVETASDGVAALDRILQGEKRCDDRVREAFVRQNSWDARVEQVHEVLQSLLPQSIHGAAAP